MDTCRRELLEFFDVEKGQVGIYDAVNPTSAHRRKWKETFEQHGIQTIFIESLCDNQEIIEQNVRSVKISSPDVLSLTTPPDNPVFHTLVPCISLDLHFVVNPFNGST